MIEVEERDWDLNTKTASDYTLQFFLKPDQVNSLKSKAAQVNNKSLGVALKDVLIECLKEEHNRINSEDEDNHQGLEIADINFYFMNADVLDLLAARGNAINNNDWDEVIVQN